MIDYVRFKRTIKPAKKNITIIGQHIKPGTLAELLVNAVIQRAQAKPDLRINVLDSADFNLRFLEAEKAPLEEPVDDYTTLQWSETVSNADSILFVTPEFHGGYTGYFKNAIDVLWLPWHNKPIGVVAYSLSNQQSSTFTQSIIDLFSAVKADLVMPIVYLPGSSKPTQRTISITPDLENSIDAILTELYTTAKEPNYFRQLYRSITDKAKRKLLKLIKPKK